MQPFAKSVSHQTASQHTSALRYYSRDAYKPLISALRTFTLQCLRNPLHKSVVINTCFLLRVHLIRRLFYLMPLCGFRLVHLEQNTPGIQAVLSSEAVVQCYSVIRDIGQVP